MGNLIFWRRCSKDACDSKSESSEVTAGTQNCFNLQDSYQCAGEPVPNPVDPRNMIIEFPRLKEFINARFYINEGQKIKGTQIYSEYVRLYPKRYFPPTPQQFYAKLYDLDIPRSYKKKVVYFGLSRKSRTHD